MLVQEHQINSPIKLVLWSSCNWLQLACAYDQMAMLDAIDCNQWNYNKDLQVHYSLVFKPEERLGKRIGPFTMFIKHINGFKYLHVYLFHNTKSSYNVCSWVQCSNPLGLQGLCAFTKFETLHIYIPLSSRCPYKKFSIHIYMYPHLV